MDDSLTLEQRRAIALAQARMRLSQQGGAGAATQPDNKQLANQYAGEDVGQMGSVMRGLGGAKTAWDRAAMGLKGLFTELTPEDRAMLEQGKAFVDQGGTAAKVGEIGGDVAITAAPAIRGAQALQAGARVLPKALQFVGGRLPSNMIASGATAAALSPEERGTAAAGGAIGAGVGEGINRVLGGVVRPFVSKEAEALMKQDIQPTIGQAVGGVTNTAEQKLRSLPLIGDVIRNARNRSVNEFNEKAIQVANPASTGFGDDALTTTREALGKQFDAVLDNLPKMSMDKNAIVSTAAQAAGDPALGLNDASKKFIQNYVNTSLIGRSQNITGETAKRVESDLLKVISRLRGSSDSEQRGIAEALSKVHNAWRTSLAQTAEAVQPGAGKALEEANAAWRAFIPVDRAGGYRGNQNVATNEVAGRFMPNSLRRSIEVSDQSQFNNATRAMRGGNTPFDRLNTLTRQGEKVLGDSVPDSGTATRLMYGAGALGAGSAAGVDPTTMGAGALLTIPLYSRGGSKFLMQGIEPLYESAVKRLALRGVPTQTVDDVLRKYGPQGVITLAREYGLSEARN